MKEAIRKADILIEALPYIQRFQGKTIVIKYGGSTMQHSDEVHSILEDIVFLHTVGIYPVVVHGGGHLISDAMRESKIKPVFIDGFRKTCEETISIVETVLTKVNKKIVKDIETVGGKAKSLTSQDAKVVSATSIDSSLGYVGKVNAVNTREILNVIKNNYIPIISPVGINNDGHPMNVNADNVATRIAEELKAEKLVLMTNVRGVLQNSEDENSCYSTLTVKEAMQLMKRKVIHGGMIPKIDAGIHAVKSGVGKVHIIDGGIQRSILLEIFTNEGIGTEIIL